MTAPGGKVAVLHHGFIPIYRVGFYERLARQGSNEYVVFHGEAPGDSGHIAVEGELPFANVRVRNRELRALGRSVVYQPLVREIAFGGYDAVVMSAQFRFASNHVVHAVMKARRRPVILWGHGRLSRLRAAQARRGDAYLAYTPGGAERLAQAGVAADRLAVVPNTIDTGTQSELRDRLRETDERELRAELGLRPESKVLVYLGRVYPEKRLGELVEALRLIGDAADVELVVLGDGPDLPRVRAAAQDLPGVHLLGAVSDQELIARHLRVAVAVVIPGKVGLAVNHAFAHGVPVITREHDLHSVEVEYVRSGVNGLIVAGGLAEFAAALSRFAGDAEQQRALADGALSSGEELTVEAMVRAFDEGVTRALARRG